MNMQSNLIWEVVLYEINLAHNATETNKTSCSAKDEGEM